MAATLAIGGSAQAASIVPAKADAYNDCVQTGGYYIPIYTARWDTGSYVASSGNLEFDTSAVTNFCFENLGGGLFQIVDESTMGCLAVNTLRGTISEDPYSACSYDNGAGYKWDQWKATQLTNYEYNNDYLFTNQTNGECMYDDNTLVATYGICHTNDTFEYFDWEAYP